MRFELSDRFVINYDDYAREGLRIAILARSGGGKSNLAALIAEQVLDHGHQLCVIEPIEEWFTLKNRYDNVVWVGDGGDLPLVPGLPQHYVRILKEGTSMVMTVSTGDEFGDKQFVAGFLWSLYVAWKKNRQPLFLLVEEADTYAPQAWTAQDRECLSRMALIAKRGRKLGLNMMTLSQRPADIHKSVISQSNMLFLGGFRTTQDLTAVKDLSKLLHLPISTEEVSQLEPGEFFTIAGGEVVRIKSYIRRTPHGGSTPELQPVSADSTPTLEAVRETLLKELERLRGEQDALSRLKRENEELRARIRDFEEQMRTFKIVKEIPLEIKAATSGEAVEAFKLSQTTAEPPPAKLPETVLKSPYSQTVKIYSYLAQNQRPTTLRELSAATGIGHDTIRKVVRYLRRKGVLKAGVAHHYGRKEVIKWVVVKTDYGTH